MCYLFTFDPLGGIFRCHRDVSLRVESPCRALLAIDTNNPLLGRRSVTQPPPLEVSAVPSALQRRRNNRSRGCTLTWAQTQIVGHRTSTWADSITLSDSLLLSRVSSLVPSLAHSCSSSWRFLLGSGYFLTWSTSNGAERTQVNILSAPLLSHWAKLGMINLSRRTST
jgi:hypothetical protein